MQANLMNYQMPLHTRTYQKLKKKYIDGQQELINYDINADTGPMKAIVKTFTGIEIMDGYLSIDIKS